MADQELRTDGNTLTQVADATTWRAPALQYCHLQLFALDDSDWFTAIDNAPLTSSQVVLLVSSIFIARKYRETARAMDMCGGIFGRGGLVMMVYLHMDLLPYLMDRRDY